MKLSIVIPVYNEEGNVGSLHEELLGVLRRLGHGFEIIFIDDGSTDGTFHELSKLRPIKIIRFRRNFGQTAAFDAGFREAVGDVVVTMDGDLQNDPKDINRLLCKLAEGYDIVCGWRKKRKDTVLKRLVSVVARFLRRVFLKDSIHDAGCSLRVYRQVVIKNLDLYGEMHRFIPSICALQGFKVAELEVNHRARKFGSTKYGWKRGLKGFVDIINVWFTYRYRNKPLHLFGGIGLIAIVVGLALTFYFVIVRLFFGVSLADRLLPIGALFLVLFGIQLFVTGLLADMLMKTYYTSSYQRGYSIYTIVKNE